MATQVTTTITDDLDGSADAETVSFGFRGTSYEVDLNAKHAEDLERALSKYMDAGRRVTSGRGRSTGASGRRSGGSSSDAPSIREWAKAQGMDVNERGRVSAEVRAAYEAAH